MGFILSAGAIAAGAIIIGLAVHNTFGQAWQVLTA